MPPVSAKIGGASGKVRSARHISAKGPQRGRERTGDPPNRHPAPWTTSRTMALAKQPSGHIPGVDPSPCRSAFTSPHHTSQSFIPNSRALSETPPSGLLCSASQLPADCNTSFLPSSNKTSRGRWCEKPCQLEPPRLPTTTPGPTQ